MLNEKVLLPVAPPHTKHHLGTCVQHAGDSPAKRRTPAGYPPTLHQHHHQPFKHLHRLFFVHIAFLVSIPIFCFFFPRADPVSTPHLLEDGLLILDLSIWQTKDYSTPRGLEGCAIPNVSCQRERARAAAARAGNNQTPGGSGGGWCWGSCE
jgi:hypothetical protein